VRALLVGLAALFAVSGSLEARPGMPQYATRTAQPRVLSVGPGQDFPTPSLAARAARDGDTVEIAAGSYEGDVAIWSRNDLTLRGVGGMAHLDAKGAAAQGKAIWIIRGNNTVIENIEFSGARVADRNGAGIRLAGAGLTVRNSRFHHNENGILCGSNPAADIVIEHSEFAFNGHGDGQSHNIYCGRVRSFTLRHSYMHDAVVGHNVKSRAERNLILYNRISDGADGTSSYAIDLPNGGFSVVLGNVIHKGPGSQNQTLLSFGAEGYRNGRNALYVVSNTFANDRPGGGRFVFVRDGADEVRLTNNLYAGPGVLLAGSGTQDHNKAAPRSDFVDYASLDLRLRPGAAGIGAGGEPGMAQDIDLNPVSQYVHKAQAMPRPRSRKLDLGAYAYP
jgi:hypothetical protein